jgi:predicted RNA-binding protein associated with RNAse of E/G family
MPEIEIHYHRPPNRMDIFVQDLVVDQDDCKVTLHENTPLTSELYIADRLIYEPGSPIVWFVFPGEWYDVGRFHLSDGTHTGYYVNLIAPPDLDRSTWTMYDLYLDLWVDLEGNHRVLDQDEFDEAVDNGWIDEVAAARARETLSQLIMKVEAGGWPPAVVRDYDLERVRGMRGRSRK